MKNLKELFSIALMCMWGTGKILGCILLILISGLYLASPMFDFVTEFLFVEHLKDTLSAIFTLWFGISVSVYVSVCIWSLR